MMLRIFTTLALLALAVALSAGLLHAHDGEAERPPYRIDLYPGWNLISFPGDPVDAALESVMGDAQADEILGYQDQQWRAAVRKTDGGWRTTSDLTTMSGSRGYWVHALAEDAIEVLLSPDTTRPSTEGCGWQLMAIWDAEQRPQGTAISADEYFSKIWWRVAYTFLADENLWTKQLPRSEGTVETGAGYWVWNACPTPCPPVSGLDASGAYGFGATTVRWDTPVRRGAGATVEVGAGYRTAATGGVALSCP